MTTYHHSHDVSASIIPLLRAAEGGALSVAHRVRASLLESPTHLLYNRTKDLPQEAPRMPRPNGANARCSTSMSLAWGLQMTKTKSDPITFAFFAPLREIFPESRRSQAQITKQTHSPSRRPLSFSCGQSVILTRKAQRSPSPARTSGASRP